MGHSGHSYTHCFLTGVASRHCDTHRKLRRIDLFHLQAVRRKVYASIATLSEISPSQRADDKPASGAEHSKADHLQQSASASAGCTSNSL